MKNRAHIMVNTRLLLKGRLAGIGRFAYEVLKRMVHKNPDIQFTFLFDRKFDPEFVLGPNVRPIVLPPQARHPVLWYTWFHVATPLLAKTLKPDLYFSPEWYLAPGLDVPQINTIHDLAYEHFDQGLKPWALRYCRKYSPKYAIRANHILTVSTFSKEDIVERYKIPSDKISVVYNGASAVFKSIDKVEKKAVRQKYSNGKPFFHFVGTLQPRKNISTLLKAFDLFKKRVEEEVLLLIVGKKGWGYQEAFEVYEAMEHQSSVQFTGYLEDSELAKVVAASEGLVYIPELEGFGIPLLEAMQCEVPVICSNRSSMPEVVGNAGLLVDPFDPEAIAEQMLKLYHNQSIGKALIEAAIVKRQRFSWEQTYEKVWQTIDNFL